MGSAHSWTSAKCKWLRNSRLPAQQNLISEGSHPHTRPSFRRAPGRPAATQTRNFRTAPSREGKFPAHESHRPTSRRRPQAVIRRTNQGPAPDQGTRRRLARRPWRLGPPARTPRDQVASDRRRRRRSSRKNLNPLNGESGFSVFSVVNYSRSAADAPGLATRPQNHLSQPTARCCSPPAGAPPRQPGFIRELSL